MGEGRGCAEAPSAKYLAEPEPRVDRSFDLLAGSPGGVAKLRELILTLAVEGKLVSPVSSDEPASVLLQKIRLEKDRLIAEGKIKREKPLAEVSEKERTLELPAGWEWVRLGSVASRVQYGLTASADPSVAQPKLLRITDIQNDRVNWATVPGVEIGSRDVSGYFLAEGDLLIARTGGTIGKSFLVDAVPVDSVFASYLIRISPLPGLNPRYLKAFASSRHYWSQVFARSMGTGQPNINGTALSELVVALPPLAEQFRIVARVEELMRLCDALEESGRLGDEQHARLTSTLFDALAASESAHALVENWHRVAEHFDLLLDRPEAIDALEQTILQLAVRGSLVEQIKDDETAQAALTRAQQQKAQMVRMGKLKRQQSFHKIVASEMPFEIPSSWAWVRLGEAALKITDGTHHSPPNGPDGEFKYVTAKNIRKWGLDLSTVTYVAAAVHHEIYSRCDPEIGDVLYVKDGATTGVLTINTLVEPFSMLSSVALLKPSAALCSEYLALVMAAPFFYDEMRAGMSGVAITRVTLSKLGDALIPLPPLAEQHRIVARVEELRRLCADLRQRLTQARDTQSRLADALVAEVA